MCFFVVVFFKSRQFNRKPISKNVTTVLLNQQINSKFSKELLTDGSNIFDTQRCKIPKNLCFLVTNVFGASNIQNLFCSTLIYTYIYNFNYALSIGHFFASCNYLLTWGKRCVAKNVDCTF